MRISDFALCDLCQDRRSVELCCPLGPSNRQRAKAGIRRNREYIAHLAGFELRVRGLAFQQQDQGVSACATTALWSAIHGVAPKEGLSIPTPADITEAASRYLLVGGRSLPIGRLNCPPNVRGDKSFGISAALLFRRFLWKVIGRSCSAI